MTERNALATQKLGYRVQKNRVNRDIGIFGKIGISGSSICVILGAMSEKVAGIGTASKVDAKFTDI